MLNTTYLRIYILTKVNEIQKEADSLSVDYTDPFSMTRAYELQGKLEILKEIFEDLKLEQHKDEKVKFHDQI